MFRSVDVLVLNTAVLDLRSSDFTFARKLVEPGGLRKSSFADWPGYSQVQLKHWIDTGKATVGGSGNTAPLMAKMGLRVAIGANLGKGDYGGLDIQGRTFFDIMQRYGVDMSEIQIHPFLPTGTTFIYETTTEERGGIVYFANANDDFDFNVFRKSVIRRRPRIVYYMYCGLSERGDANCGRDLAMFMRWCSKQGCITIADSHTLTENPKILIEQERPVETYRLVEPLIPELDLFFTSADEARMIENTFGISYRRRNLSEKERNKLFLEFLLDVASKTGRRARMFGVTVKNGAMVVYIRPDGSLVGPQMIVSKFMAGEVIDLVGAGDSFRAGLLAYVARNRNKFTDGSFNVSDAVQMGNLTASLYIKAPLHDRYRYIKKYEVMLHMLQTNLQYSSFDELLRQLERYSTVLI